MKGCHLLHTNHLILGSENPFRIHVKILSIRYSLTVAEFCNMLLLDGATGFQIFHLMCICYLLLVLYSLFRVEKHNKYAQVLTVHQAPSLKPIMVGIWWIM